MGFKFGIKGFKGRVYESNVKWWDRWRCAVFDILFILAYLLVTFGHGNKYKYRYDQNNVGCKVKSCQWVAINIVGFLGQESHPYAEYIEVASKENCTIFKLKRGKAYFLRLIAMHLV